MILTCRYWSPLSFLFCCALVWLLSAFPPLRGAVICRVRPAVHGPPAAPDPTGPPKRPLSPLAANGAAGVGQGAPTDRIETCEMKREGGRSGDREDRRNKYKRKRGGGQRERASEGEGEREELMFTECFAVQLFPQRSMRQLECMPGNVWEPVARHPDSQLAGDTPQSQRSWQMAHCNPTVCPGTFT